MSIGQILTMVTLGISGLVSVAGIITGAVYLTNPFDFVVAGHVFPAESAFSPQAAVIALLFAAVPAASAASLVWIQQAIVRTLVHIEMRKLAFCECEIRETFGSEAAERWLGTAANRLRLEKASDSGLF